MQVIHTPEGALVQCSRFDITQTFCCGQCFRFDRVDGGFGGTAFGRYIRLSQTADGVLISTTEQEFEAVWRQYFDLDTDYDELIGTFPMDMHLSRAIAHCGGLRILKQDPFETLISFVISQNNNIPRIKKLISAVCERYGDKNGDVYAFPTPEALVDADLSDMHLGYRAPYVTAAARDFYTGRLHPDRIRAMEYGYARKELLMTTGIGPKVADCVLLFGYGFMQAFPVDTWVKKALKIRYGDGFDPNYFGINAGLAQQYLFYYERGTRE